MNVRSGECCKKEVPDRFNAGHSQIWCRTVQGVLTSVIHPKGCEKIRKYANPKGCGALEDANARATEQAASCTGLLQRQILPLQNAEMAMSPWGLLRLALLACA